jgi:predicted Zn-ribbon and HTH transcriptional regulator
MVRGCPGCGSKNLRPSLAENAWEAVKAVLGFGPVRCRDCDLRFSEAKLWVPGLHYAKCPKCFREDLHDWSEKYFYPPWYRSMLVYLGAKKHRCPKCRYNFVSYFPRKGRSNAPVPTDKAAIAELGDTVNSER